MGERADMVVDERGRDGIGMGWDVPASFTAILESIGHAAGARCDSSCTNRHGWMRCDRACERAPRGGGKGGAKPRDGPGTHTQGRLSRYREQTRHF